MERGVEQLILFAIIIVAALLDMFVRGLKKKQQQNEPPEEFDADEAEPFEEPVYVEPEPEVVIQRAPVPPPAPPRQLPTTPTLPPPVLPPRVLPAPVPARQYVPSAPRPVVLRQPRRDIRRWFAQPIDARRGIVMMEVLGPCRALSEDK